MIAFENIPQRDFNEVRGFGDHEMAVTIDSDGGICSLSFIDSHTHDGVTFPDEKPLSIFSREEGNTFGYPIYGPAIAAYSMTVDHRTLPHRPTTQTVFPWGLMGGDEEQHYRFILHDNCLLWNCRCNVTNRDSFVWCYQPDTLFKGTKLAYMDQHGGDGSTQTGSLYQDLGIPQPAYLPKLNGQVPVTWSEDSYDEANQTLYFRGEIGYPFGTKEWFLAVGCDAPVQKETAPALALLRAKWDKPDSITVCMALAPSREEAAAKMRHAVVRFDEILDSKIAEARQIEQDCFKVQSENLPLAEDFSHMAAQYLNTVKVGKTPEGHFGFRAAIQKFGYFSIWDAIFPIRDLLWNGQAKEACRHITYLLRLPNMENTPISGLHAILEWNEIRAFCSDEDIPDLYPEICKIFSLAAKATEPQYRLLKYCGNTGVDHPEQVGMHEAFLSCEVNAFWYIACRIVRNEAIVRGDTATIREASSIIAAIEKGYAKAFFMEDPGYLRVAAPCDLGPTEFDIFQNSNTLGMDYPLGFYLMRDLVDAMASYQSHQLWHPMGHRAAAFNSTIPVEMMKYVHMNQHNGHEMKLQRLSGNMPEVNRVLGEYLKVFDRWKVAQETFNFSRFYIHASQVTNWQTFSATACMEALRAAVAGIICHRGGLCYFPAPDQGDVELREVPRRADRITLSVTGSGAYAHLELDGTPIFGTLQLPADIEVSHMRVIRQDTQPNHPVLISAYDLPVTQVAVSENNALSFRCGETVHAPILLQCDHCPKVLANGQEILVQWNPKKQHVWMDALWTRDTLVEII